MFNLLSCKELHAENKQLVPIVHTVGMSHYPVCAYDMYNVANYHLLCVAVCLVLFPRHTCPEARDNTINLIHTLRDYLHYHIKCSKVSQIHSFSWCYVKWGDLVAQWLRHWIRDQEVTGLTPGHDAVGQHLKQVVHTHVLPSPSGISW